MKPNGLKIVIALGGNAISPPEGRWDINQQFHNSRIAAGAMATMIGAGHRLALTHGNGPQVGAILRRVELAMHELYPLPLDICVANSQAGMGYMIAQCLTNELRSRGMTGRIGTVVTSVAVDPSDPAFTRPTKPIGSVYAKEDAEKHQCENHWQMSEVSPGKFRRVVPSPLPRFIVELPLIRTLFEGGETVISCGGGGIPVVQEPNGEFRGVAAVIDKDLTSALLATGLEADALLILTAVDRVYSHFGKPDQKPLDRLTVTDARRLLAEREFPSGSMGPKIQAAINFLTSSVVENARVIITSLSAACDAIAGKAGTAVVRD